MLDLDTSGIDSFLAELEAEQRSMNRYINEQYKRLVEIVFSDILHGTPQWSGNLAANWFIGINSQNQNEETIPEKAIYWPHPPQEPFDRLDPNYRALEVSEARLKDVPVFSYLDDIYIYNPAYPATEADAHTIYIRPVNTLNQAVMMTAWAGLKYEILNPLPA